MASVLSVPLWLTSVITASNATPVIDPHSYARPAEARVTHVALDLRADFARKVLEGTATLTLQAAADAREVVLDTRGLEIQGVVRRQGHGADVCAGSRRSDSRQSAHHHAARRPRNRGRALPHVATGRGAAVAVARADGRRRAPVSVLAGPGDPHAHVDPDAGQPGCPSDLPRPHRRARAVARGDERGGADAGRRGGRRRPRLRVQARAAGAALPDCASRLATSRSNPSDRDRASTPSRRWSSARPPSLPTSRR